MDVTKLLEERERFRDYRVFYPILFAGGKYSLSVQASKLCYCSPRETLGDISQYTHFEVKANIPDEDVPAGWDLDSRIEGWAPVEEINDLIRKLDAKYGLDEGIIFVDE